ncbi:MAG: alpha/beta fold hydrolase [Mycobacterium sp.]
MTVLERFSVSGPAGVVSGVRRSADGPGVPVVFVHNINGAAAQWTPVLTRLADRTVVAVDLRGHGFSHPGDAYGAADYAADVAAAMDALGIVSAHLVGASFGGSATVTLAASQPVRVQSVTVIGGALGVSHLDPDAVIDELHRLGPTTFFEQFAAMSFAPGTDDALLDDAVRWAVRNDAATVEQIIRAAFCADISAAAARVTVPALVLTGEHDRTCPPALGAALATALGTKCRVLPGRGHMAHLEDPVLLTRLIDKQLRDTDSVPTG